jgi:hypothetical protein
VDALTGKNVVGEPVTPQSMVVRTTVPLSMQDIYEVMQDNGVPAGVAFGILSLFGFGVQHYEEGGNK